MRDGGKQAADEARQAWRDRQAVRLTRLLVVGMVLIAAAAAGALLTTTPTGDAVVREARLVFRSVVYSIERPDLEY